MTGGPPLPRPLRAVLGAVIGGVVCVALGGMALNLTLHMLLARHLTVSQEMILSRVLLAGCGLFGMVFGACFDPRWLTSQVRWICWGAVLGLALLLVVEVWLHQHVQTVHGRSQLRLAGRNYNIDELAFLSAPGALLAGGFLGWFAHWLRHRHEAKPPTETNL